MATIPDRYYIDLRGKRYPVYEGVLVTAMENGLRCLETSIVQVPNEANGWMAVVMATATFDGPEGRDRVFSDVGDCSPKNCSATIATAALRMASTRAKGRVLRDGIGLGQTLAEELPDEEAPAAHVPRPLARHEGKADTYRQERAARTTDSPGDAAASGYVADGGTEALCAWPDCGLALTKNQQTMSQHKIKMNLCAPHLREMLAQAAAKP